MMSCVVNRQFSWLVAAHRLLVRFDAFLVSGLLPSLTTVTEEEDERAKIRVRRLNLPETPDVAATDTAQPKLKNGRSAEAGSSNYGGRLGKRGRSRNNGRSGGRGGGGGRGSGRGAGSYNDNSPVSTNGKS